MVNFTVSTTILVSTITSFVIPIVTIVPTSAVVTIITYIPTSALVLTSVFISSTIISTKRYTNSTTSEREVNVSPFHARLLVYLLFAMYRCFNAWLVSFTHGERLEKISYTVFFIVFVVDIVLSCIANILFDLSFVNNLTAPVIWGQHLNIGTDVVTLFGVIIQFSLIAKKTHWTRGHSVRGGGTPNRALWVNDCRTFILSILILSLPYFGHLSSIATIFTSSLTAFAKFGGRYIGKVC